MPFITNPSNFKTHYAVDGNLNGPPLLLAHGFGNCIKNWYGLGYVEALGKDFKLIMVDSRGFGQSDKPYDNQFYEPQLLADEHITVLDALNIKQCHFFGNSRGGNLGFLLAKLYPERFLSFTIGGAQPYGSLPNSTYYFSEWLKAGIEKGAEFFMEQLEEALGQPFPANIRADYKNNDLNALLAAYSWAWPNCSEAMKQHPAPCMLYVGGDDPYVIDMEKFAKETPRCQFHILPGMNHAEAYWEGKKISPLIADFIKSVAS